MGQLINIFDKKKKKLFRSFDRIFIQKISKEEKLSILEKKGSHSEKIFSLKSILYGGSSKLNVFITRHTYNVIQILLFNTIQILSFSNLPINNVFYVNYITHIKYYIIKADT